MLWDTVVLAADNVVAVVARAGPLVSKRETLSEISGGTGTSSDVTTGLSSEMTIGSLGIGIGSLGIGIGSSLIKLNMKRNKEDTICNLQC